MSAPHLLEAFDADELESLCIGYACGYVHALAIAGAGPAEMQRAARAMRKQLERDWGVGALDRAAIFLENIRDIGGGLVDVAYLAHD